MTFFKKYFNWLFIALCVAGVYYGKLSAGAWLLLFSAGTIVFAYFAIVFMRERCFFEQKLSAEDLAKFKQLCPLINPLGIKIANPTWDTIEKERNDRLKQISANCAEHLITSEKVLSKLCWIFMVWCMLAFNVIVKAARG